MLISRDVRRFLIAPLDMPKWLANRRMPSPLLYNAGNSSAGIFDLRLDMVNAGGYDPLAAELKVQSLSIRV